MANHSFDDAVVSRFDDSASSDKNALNINALSADDFKDFNALKRYDPISGIAVMPKYDFSGLKDPEIIIAPLATAGKPELPHGLVPIKEPAFTHLPGFDITNRGDGISRYPLPEDVSVASGESALSVLNQRIINKAVAKVQESMTPKEKQELNRDAQKYAEQMKDYEKQMKIALVQDFFRKPEDWPKPPAKPQSMVKYEEAVDREIQQITKKMTA